MTETRSLAVTGGASGIGRAIVEVAAAGDFDEIWVLDRDEQALRDAIAQLPTRSSLRVEGRAVDVTSREGLASLADEWGQSGHPNLFVNCAGIRVSASLPDTTAEDWDRTVTVNLTGTFNTLQTMTRGWMASGSRGVFVAIASLAGETGFSDRAAYSASKAGVIGLVRSSALDLAPHGIRVIAISPGLIQTAMSRPEDDEFVERVVPMGRRGDPRELATLIFDVAKSELLTGISVVADGGLSAGYRL